MYTKYNDHDGVKMVNQEDLPAIYLDNTWSANLFITGADGLPEVAMAAPTQQGPQAGYSRYH